MNKNHIRFYDAAIGTIAHTAIIYGAPALGLKKTDIGRMLSSRLFFTKKRGPGLGVHGLLGTVIFPTSYNLVARHFLPKEKGASALIWGLTLWTVGQNIIVPLLAGPDYFKKRPSAKVAYFLAHLAYGFFCGTLNIFNRNCR